MGSVPTTSRGASCAYAKLNPEVLFELTEEFTQNLKVLQVHTGAQAVFRVRLSC